MIERDVIEDLIKLMIAHDLAEMDIVDGEQSVTLRRATPAGPGAVVGPYAQPAALVAGDQAGAAAGLATPAAAAVPSDASSDAMRQAGAPDSGQGGETIASPMVGTFYSKSAPDAQRFVAVGDEVDESTVVCLVEAMKVFNEIKAEIVGVISEILVTDGDPVEYGQTLFRVQTA